MMALPPAQPAISTAGGRRAVHDIKSRPFRSPCDIPYRRCFFPGGKTSLGPPEPCCSRGVLDIAVLHRVPAARPVTVVGPGGRRLIVIVFVVEDGLATLALD
jgi:hypothetical protein